MAASIPDQDQPWRAVVIHAADTVAVALVALRPGPARVRRGDTVDVFTVHEPIPMGHKLAVADIAEGDAVIKYGESIGLATAAIPVGCHVHVHNLRSRRARGGPTGAIKRD